jgi:carboxyl-terminal processing protease
MKMKKLIYLLILLFAVTGSCKKDTIAPDDSTSGTSVTPAMARDSLYYIMKAWYYWYNKPEAVSVTTANKSNYPDPYKLLEAMRYKTLDRWSFIEDYDKFIAETQGKFVGHGFRIGVDNSLKARIALIYNNSPLYANGVRRGWIIKSINGTNPAPILISGDTAAYSNLVQPGRAGITNTFVFTRPNGTDTTISSTKSSFDINTVLLSEVLQLSSGPTGHLVFESFFDPAPDELAAAFKTFKENNITNLILDLRYNSGGDLMIAQKLASYLAGNSPRENIFLKLQHNDQRQSYNSIVPFVTTVSPMTLPKLVVITSRSTASASEDVINGLKPLFDVITLGDTTNGKPTGMYSWLVAKKYAMLPISFKVVNSQDQGDFFDGIFPAKVIGDDITRDFNDREESCFKEAVSYLENGSFSTKSLMTFKSYPQFSEKPQWMNNAFGPRK